MEIRLEAFSGGVGLSSQDVVNIVWNAQIRPKKIVTIEKLTALEEGKKWSRRV